MRPVAVDSDWLRSSFSNTSGIADSRERHEVSNSVSSISLLDDLKKSIALRRNSSQNTETNNVPWEGYKNCDVNKDVLFRTQTWIPTCGTTRESNTNTVNSTDYFSLKRRISLQLPSSQSPEVSRGDCKLSEQDATFLLSHRLDNIPRDIRLPPPNLLSASVCAGIPPLTPPPEDWPDWKSNHQDHKIGFRSNVPPTSQPDQPSQNQDQNRERGNFGRRLQGIALPQSSGQPESSQLHKLPWTVKASRKLAAILNSTPGRDQVQVVSQTLPSQARDSRSRPTFEEVLNTLQAEMEASPYVTITHAVPQARIMEELPKTPPSTPGLRTESSDYFNNDQTIFTHAAVVPIYHNHDRIERNVTDRPVHHIAAPNSVHVSILERYIPPTMPEEVDDFFSISPRSYLADRLSELSARNGSLLLVYPTLAGARTFARQYIGPVIDPYLRQFVMLNGLTSDAAALMGTMTAVDAMIDFEEMNIRVNNLCRNLAARPVARGPPSTFSITYSETANVILDRSTWANWYIEQEQSRLRQNLVEYHQSGGRMPQVEGTREVTVGMLTRDFIDGFPKNQGSAGNVEIEVGVFLITRSML